MKTATILTLAAVVSTATALVRIPLTKHKSLRLIGYEHGDFHVLPGGLKADGPVTIHNFQDARCQWGSVRTPADSRRLGVPQTLTRRHVETKPPGV